MLSAVPLADTCWPPFLLYGWCPNTGSFMRHFYGFLETIMGELIVLIPGAADSLFVLPSGSLSSAPVLPLPPIYPTPPLLLPKRLSCCWGTIRCLESGYLLHYLLNLFIYYHPRGGRPESWLVLVSFSLPCALQTASVPSHPTNPIQISLGSTHTLLFICVYPKLLVTHIKFF